MTGNRDPSRQRDLAEAGEPLETNVEVSEEDAERLAEEFHDLLDFRLAIELAEEDGVFTEE